MHPMVFTDPACRRELRPVAAALMWWQPPEVSLSQPARFLAQVMVLATWRQVQTVRAVCGWEAFREVLDHAPPGVFDRRSWSYWHAFFGLPERPLPTRALS